MFENADGQWTDGGVTGILIAHNHINKQTKTIYTFILYSLGKIN